MLSRSALGLVLLIAASCNRITGSRGAGGDVAPSSEPTTATSATASSAPAASAGPPPTPGAPRAIRVYVAGESIERRVRWIERPLLPDGRLNARGDARNDDDEYGWVVPFAERIAIRAPGTTVAWVGADRWLGHDDEAYDGKFPSAQAGATSAISGTSIESWLEQRRGELEKKKHCYDLAIAARGGNDFESDDESVTKQIEDLVGLLLRGSSCQASPLVVVTGHMPDDQRGGKGPDDRAYVEQQKRRFVERFRRGVDALRAKGGRVRFVDVYTPFVENKKTTAFPAEAWSRGGVPDYAKIGRMGDRMHPRRLASIYAGEIVADSIDLSELPR